jgi:hypothetical protein
MWRSVFLHEFIDRRITNFQALPGTLTSPSFTLAPSPAIVAGTNSVEVTRGKGLEYILDEPLRDVIGLSCRLRVAYPIPNEGLGHLQGFPLLNFGFKASILSLAQTDPLPDLSGIRSLVGFLIGDPNQVSTSALTTLASRSFTDVRVDWHTSGQARIAVDGRLVGYSNALATGTTFDLDRLSFGLPGEPPQTNAPQYQIARVFVRVLTRTDALVTLSRLLPKMPPGKDRGRCHLLVLANLLNLLDRLRPFMAAFHEAKSQPWTEENGPPEGPFQPDAIEAHQLAVSSMLALKEMLRTGDFSKPDAFLDPFTKFLQILRASQPEQFDALAAELLAADVVPEGCRDLLESQLKENGDALNPIIDLLTAATKRVQEIMGGKADGEPT